MSRETVVGKKRHFAGIHHTGRRGMASFAKGKWHPFGIYESGCDELLLGLARVREDSHAREDADSFVLL